MGHSVTEFKLDSSDDDVTLQQVINWHKAVNT